jgi:hypothetical protein
MKKTSPDLLRETQVPKTCQGCTFLKQLFPFAAGAESSLLGRELSGKE